MLGRDRIAALIPHKGAMCLLHEVISHDPDQITCRAVNHHDAAHPLRENGTLPAICGVEYAAQAMAVHGALAGGVNVSPGVLAAVREVTLHVEALDEVEGDLIVNARKVWGDSSRLLYEFTIRGGSLTLLEGRAAVVLKPAAS